MEGATDELVEVHEQVWFGGQFELIVFLWRVFKIAISECFFFDIGEVQEGSFFWGSWEEG
jgi:hypothetical protein